MISRRRGSRTRPSCLEPWVQLAAAGDPTDMHWPVERDCVLLGAVALDALAPDNAAASKHIIVDPIPRVYKTRTVVYLSGRNQRTAPALEA